MRRNSRLRRGDGNSRELRVAIARSDDRQHHLHNGDAKSEDQGIMASLGDHRFTPI